MNRRSFLKTGLVGAGLLALGGTGLALFPTRYSVKATRALRVLDERCFQVLAAVARRVVRDPGADAVAIAHGVDDLLPRLPVETQVDFRRLVLLFESALGGLLLDGRLRPFTRLSDEEQDRVLMRWRDSRIAVRRVGYEGLKKICYIAHYVQPASWADIGFPPPMSVSGPYDDSKMGTPEWLKEHGLEAIP
jgi:TAT (twin-arginine translocation) pathway signal sequence